MVVPLEALGAAAAITQFAESAGKLAREVYDIYKSGDGVSRHTQRLIERCTSLREFGDRMKQQLDPDMAKNTQAEQGLWYVADQCHATTDQLLRLLEDLKAKGPRSVLKSATVAAKAKRRQEKILALAEWLNQLQIRMQVCLQEIMRYAVKRAN